MVPRITISDIYSNNETNSLLTPKPQNFVRRWTTSRLCLPTAPRPLIANSHQSKLAARNSPSHRTANRRDHFGMIAHFTSEIAEIVLFLAVEEMYDLEGFRLPVVRNGQMDTMSMPKGLSVFGT